MVTQSKNSDQFKIRHYLSFKIIDCKAIHLGAKLEFSLLPIAVS